MPSSFAWCIQTQPSSKVLELIQSKDPPGCILATAEITTLLVKVGFHSCSVKFCQDCFMFVFPVELQFFIAQQCLSVFLKARKGFSQNQPLSSDKKYPVIRIAPYPVSQSNLGTALSDYWTSLPSLLMERLLPWNS